MLAELCVGLELNSVLGKLPYSSLFRLSETSEVLKLRLPADAQRMHPYMEGGGLVGR